MAVHTWFCVWLPLAYLGPGSWDLTPEDRRAGDRQSSFCGSSSEGRLCEAGAFMALQGFLAQGELAPTWNTSARPGARQCPVLMEAKLPFAYP